MGLWSMTYGHDPAAASKELEQSLKLDSANVAAGGWYPFLLTSYLHLPDSARRGRATRATTQPVVVRRLESIFPFARFHEAVTGQRARALRARCAHSGAAGGAVRRAAEPSRERPRAVPPQRGGAGPAPTPSGRDLAYLAVNLIAAGDSSGAREALRQALARSNTEYVREDLIANAYMRLGDREQAIQWLVKGAASNVGGIEFSLEDPLFAPVRSDPRIQTVIERMKAQ